MVEKTAQFFFIMGAQPAIMKAMFGSKENGRLRGFTVPLDKDDVMDISMAEKLAAHKASLQVLAEAQWHTVRQQHGPDQVPVTCLTHDPAALAVLSSVHEAARAIAAEVDMQCLNPADPQVQVAQALWPAITKMAGKAVDSLAIANVFARVVTWACAGGPALKDSKVRFADALAASLKICLHLAGQAFAERVIIASSSATPRSITDQDDDRFPRPPKVEPSDASNAELVAGRLLQALACQCDSRKLLLQGGISEKFGKQHKAFADLRRARDYTLNISPAAWKNGVRHLCGKGVLVSDGQGSWKLATSAAAIAAVTQMGVNGEALATHG